MTTQIAIRLPDELVGAVDRIVSAGGATSRADLVTRDLRRELRRRRTIEDLDRLGGDDPELAAWVEYAAHAPLDLD